MRKHLKLCLLLSLFLAIFSVAFADTVMIGSGTTTTSYLPIYGLYGYNYTQQIYTQNQIDYAGEIEKIRFYYVSGMITNCKDWTIYMGHTDKTSFGTTTDWVPITELTEVYSGDVSSFLPTANNWMEIPLDTVFDYNNLNNLVIAVHEHTPGYNSMSWGAFTSGTATGIYYYNDNNNPDPANPPIASGRTGSINRLQLVFPSTTPPLAPTLVAPANNAVNQDMPILSWQATSGGGDPSTYDLYLGTDPNPPLFAEDLNQASYQFTVYDYETDYYWKVVAKNHLGSSPESETWKFTTRLDPNRPLPYFQDFDSGTSLAAIEWGGDMYISTTHGADGTNGLYKNMYSYTNTTNVVSCPIGPMLPNSELKFDYRFVEYSNYPNNPKVLVAGDEILVQISTDGGITYTTIHTIDHTNHTNTNQFTTATVNLSAYDSGNVKFKLVTNWGGGDYYIDIDNFMVREVPEYPILSINPDALDFGTVFYNATSEIKNVIVSNSGVGVLHLEDTDVEITGTNADLFSFDDTVFPFALTTGESAPIPVSLVGTIEGDVSANLEITYDGNTETVALSANVLPQGTAIIGDGTLTQRQPFSGTWGYERSAAIYTLAEIGNPGMIESIGWNASSSRTNSYPYKIYLGVTADTQVTAQTFDNLIQDMTLVHEGDYVFDSPDWHTFTLSDPFAFVGGNLIVAVETNYGGSGGGSTPNFYYTTATNAHMFWYADGSEPATSSTINSNRPNLMLSLGELSGPPELSVSPASINFGDAVFGATLPSRNINLSNIGGGSITIAASDVSIVGSPQFDYDSSVFPLVIGSAETLTIPVTLTGTIEGPATATITISYGGEDFDIELSANVLPDGLVVIGDGTANNYMPVNTYYGYSYAQMLYMADEILVEGRQINKVAYHWNGAGAAPNSDSWTLYMGHTDKTAFASTSDWIELDDLSLVYQGTVNMPAENMWIEIELDTPFVYNGVDNLVIAARETQQGYDSSSYFFYNTPSTTGRSIRCQNYSTIPDPAAPPTGTLTAAHPNIRMYFGDIPADPVFAISPNVDEWDFGLKPRFSTSTKAFTIANNGAGTLTVNSVTVTGDGFALQEAFVATDLASTESVVITVVYNPDATGDYEGLLAITSTHGSHDVDLIGSCYDPVISEFPFFEGFEVDNTDASTNIAQWEQIVGPDLTSERWTANSSMTTYARTPRSGDWNATLRYNGESTLVRPILLEAGEEYSLEFWARQDAASGATIRAMLSDNELFAGDVLDIVPASPVLSGDYQQFGGDFEVAVSGLYYLGIYGHVTYTPWYISIDDIKIIEISDDPVLSYSPESIDFGDAVFGATVGPRNITIVNDGGGTLNLEVTDIEITGTNADLFSFDDSVFPVSLGTGITASIPVFVTGTAEGSASATLIINYDGVGHEIALSANILPDGLVLIGDGTADNKMPVNPWYGYSYAQMLYKADEILTQGRQIEKVAYHWNGVNIGINSDQWTIYMGHTDKEAFDSTTDWIDINELTEVFQGDVEFLAQETWIEIMLQMPFVYNGTDNLVIAVHETRPGNDGNYAFFYNTPSTTGRSLRCHSDSANPEPAAPPTGTLTAAYPNIRMYFGDVPDEPVLSITPDSWDAGEIKINTQASQQFTIRNIGGGTLVVNELEVSGDYFTLAAPFTGASLETAESVQFTVNFDPLATGDYQGSITIDTSIGVENIEIEGSCFDPTIDVFPHTEDFDGEWTGSPAAPAGWTVINANNDSYTWRQSSQYISPTHSAPYAANGTGNTDDYLITPPIMMPANNLRLKWWDKVEGANYPNKYKILISTTDTEITSFTEELLDVTCTNTAWTEKSVDINAATYNGTIFVAFYQYASTSAVWGFGIDDFSIEELSSTPIFAADQDSYDFGETMINTTDSKSIMVGNIGGGELVITGIEISGDDAFALGTHPTLPATLERDEFINFDVTFSPTAVGDYNATIIITDNLNNRYSVNAGSRRSNNTHSRAANTVTLTGSCFDPTIRTFPFFEGFEDGNTHNTTAINQWEQIIGTGTKQWTANNSFTDRNRTPRSGSWNIFLQYSGESTLIRPIMLEANQEYKLTFYARQDHANRTHANVKAKFGAGNTLDDLTETIIEQTNVGDGNYQEFSGVFSTETAGIYFIGITGWISGTPWYLSLDDITIDYNYIVTPNDHADVGGDTTALVTGAGFVGALDVPVDPEDLTPIPNPSFVVINHQVWQLIGTGEINLRFDNNGTEDIWFSHVVGGAWLPQEIPAGGHINVTVNLDAKDARFEFALGRGGNPTLPVELSYFNAVFMLNENSVKLSWKTESETQMLGYQIYRSMNTELANAILITPVIVTASNSSTGDSYSYLDKEVESGTYYYWLEAVSYNSSDYYGYQTVVIDIPSAPELPEISSMGNAYPNPFKNATSIDIAIKGGETGSFTIYNMLGQAVYREKLSEGNATIQWHGRDSNGNRCGSGVYFYKLVTPTKAETKKMVIMK